MTKILNFFLEKWQNFELFLTKHFCLYPFCTKNIAWKKCWKNKLSFHNVLPETIFCKKKTNFLLKKTNFLLKKNKFFVKKIIYKKLIKKNFEKIRLVASKKKFSEFSSHDFAFFYLFRYRNSNKQYIFFIFFKPSNFLYIFLNFYLTTIFFQYFQLQFEILHFFCSCFS